MRPVRYIILVLGVFLLLSGCQTNDGNQAALGTSKEPVYSAIPQKDAERIKAEVERMKEVDSVTAVQVDEDVYLTLTVSGFDRLFLKDIRKGAHERAKKVNNKAIVHVSTDKKVDRDLSQIETAVKNRTITKEELKKKLKKADDDMKG